MAKEEIEIHSVENFKSAILALRKAKKWSQERLALELQVTQRQVSRWETGKGVISPKSFLKVLEALNGTLLVRYER